MITIFKTDKGSYEIKENMHSWTITYILNTTKIEVKANMSKKDYSTLEEVKKYIMENL